MEIVDSWQEGIPTKYYVTIDSEGIGVTLSMNEDEVKKRDK